MESKVYSNAKFLSIATFLAYLGFFTCTWDKILFIPAFGFKFKLTQAAFLACWLTLLCGFGYKKFLDESSQLFKGKFIKLIFALTIYYIVLIPFSYFRYKSFMYSLWLIFDVFIVWTSFGIILKYWTRRQLISLVSITMAFHVGIVLVDQIAFYFGYRGGFIGFNQEVDLNWGLSRPTGFSYEPSYIATFLSIAFTLVLPVVMKLGMKSLRAVLFVALGTLGIVITTSRSGWAMMSLGFALVLLLEVVKRKKINIRKIGILTSAFLLAMGVFRISFELKPQSEKRIFQQNIVDASRSTNARLLSMQNAIFVARDTKFLGAGLGASYTFVVDHYDVLQKGVDVVKRPNLGAEAIMSIWGQLAAEGGAFVLLCFLLATLYQTEMTRQAWKISSDGLVSGALAAALVVFYVAAFCVGNLARLDIWVWFVIIHAISDRALTSPHLNDLVAD